MRASTWALVSAIVSIWRIRRSDAAFAAATDFSAVSASSAICDPTCSVIAVPKASLTAVDSRSALSGTIDASASRARSAAAMALSRTRTIASTSDVPAPSANARARLSAPSTVVTRSFAAFLAWVSRASSAVPSPSSAARWSDRSFSAASSRSSAALASRSMFAISGATRVILALLRSTVPSSRPNAAGKVSSISRTVASSAVISVSVLAIIVSADAPPRSSAAASVSACAARLPSALERRSFRASAPPSIVANRSSILSIPDAMSDTSLVLVAS